MTLIIQRGSRFASLFVLVALAGCIARGSTTQPPAGIAAARSSLFDSYTLQSGDEISIKFYKNPELDEDVVIRPDGMISLQLIGDVLAAGTQPMTLRELLAARYSGELADPKIAVIVRKLGAHRIHVGGEVTASGAIPLTPGLTLLEAIQEAGGFLETAHRQQVVLIRRELDGEPIGYTVDMNPVIRGTDPKRDVWLQPYDIVFVPRSPIANVNLFVKQYIRNVLPIEPSVGFIP